MPLVAGFEDVRTVDVNAFPVSSIVKVDGNVDFNGVLPGNWYERTILVGLSLNKSVLTGFASSNVSVFVRVASLAGEDSSLLFEVNGKTSKVARFSLVCIVQNYACSSGSILVQPVKVRLKGISSKQYRDKIIVNTSLSPIPLASIEVNAENLMPSVASLEDRLNALKATNPSAEVYNVLSSVADSLNLARQYLAELELKQARKEIVNVQKELLQAEKDVQNKGSSFSGLFTAVLPSIPWLIGLVAFALLAFVAYVHVNKSKRHSGLNKVVPSTRVVGYFDTGYVKQNPHVTLVAFVIGLLAGFSLFLVQPALSGYFTTPSYAVESAFVSPLFSPGSQDEFENLVRSARNSIELEVYTFSSTALREELVNAAGRGVAVKVILDKSISSNYAVSRELVAGGVEVKWAPAAFERTHSKFMLIDGEVVVVGSNNWTFHSFNLNREASVIVKNVELASKFSDVFYQDWEQGVYVV